MVLCYKLQGNCAVISDALWLYCTDIKHATMKQEGGGGRETQP